MLYLLRSGVGYMYAFTLYTLRIILLRMVMRTIRNVCIHKVHRNRDAVAIPRRSPVTTAQNGEKFSIRSS